MEAYTLNDALSAIEYLQNIEGYNPREQIDADRLEAKSILGKKYPNAPFGDLFLMNFKKAQRENAICQNCTGYPCKKNVNAGYKKVVCYSEMYKDCIVVNVECEYRKQHLKMEAVKKQFARAQIPALYAGKTFADYEVTADNSNAVKWAHYVLENPNTGLYFFGSPGVGKTFLAALIAQEYLKQGRTVIFSDVPNLLNDMRDSFKENSDKNIDEMMKVLTEAEILILDDLGTEISTEWAIERLYLIINSRYTNKRQTFITSNYNLDDVAARLNTPKNGKAGVTGSRIASRLREMCKTAILKGKDRRL